MLLLLPAALIALAPGGRAEQGKQGRPRGPGGRRLGVGGEPVGV